MSYQHRVYLPDGTYWVDLIEDDSARTVTTYDETGAVLAVVPYDAEQAAAADQAAAEAAAQAEREADRKAVRAILDSINADVIDAAQATKAAAQAILDATAPTNVAGCWTQIKAAARVIRDTDNAIIEAGRSIKALAKYTRDL